MPRITFLPMNVTVDVAVGTTLLEAAHQHDLSLEGACEGSLACSTCHVLVSPQWYGRLSSAPEEEEDILDRAFGVTPTSRLACQIVMEQKLDGLEVTIPNYSVNLRLKGEKKG